MVKAKKFTPLLFCLLLVIANSSCSQVDLPGDRILIGETPIMAEYDSVIAKMGKPIDSGKTSVNSCFYFESDSCTYYKFINGAVYLKDKGKLHFNSFRYSDSIDLIVSINAMKVGKGMSFREFKKVAKKAALQYESQQFPDRRYVYSIDVKDGCNLSFVFRNGKIDAVYYGYYWFVRPAGG